MIAERVATTRRVPVAVLVAITLAWAAALAAHATGNAQALDHDALLGDGTGRSLPAVAAFAGAWTVMVVAMMLPSATPLVRLFVVLSSDQPRARLAQVVFVGGYLAVWSLFGWLALTFDAAVHRAVEVWPWLDAHPSLVLAAVLAMAGAFQHSELKDRCLTACRHPAAYLLSRYRRGPLPAFRIGWHHGLFCLGCCWALMLVAFATGATDLRLMAGFTALMAYEKIGRHGELVARRAGFLLIATAVVVAVGAVR